jgi:hypothetical protein
MSPSGESLAVEAVHAWASVTRRRLPYNVTTNQTHAYEGVNHRVSGHRYLCVKSGLAGLRLMLNSRKNSLLNHEQDRASTPITRVSATLTAQDL